MIENYPQRNDTVIHVPTAAKFTVTRRTRNRQTGNVELWNGGTIYPAAECELLLNDAELATVVEMCSVMTVEDLELLETLTSEQKRQVWAALSPEVRERLKNLRQVAA